MAYTCPELSGQVPLCGDSQACDEVLRALSVRRPPAGNVRARHPARRGRVPHRQDLRRLEPEASSIPAPTQQALRTLEWVDRRENLVVCGPSGTGKTFLLEALGQQAVEPG